MGTQTHLVATLYFIAPFGDGTAYFLPAAKMSSSGL